MPAMTRLRAVLAACAFAGLGGCATTPPPAVAAFSLAAVDDVELAARSAYALPLHWHNVEGAPYWVAGAAPHRAWNDRLHRIALGPATTTTLRLAARQRLRLVAAQSLRDVLQVSSRDGSGLARAESLLFTATGTEALLDPARDEPLDVEIALASTRVDGAEFAAFIDRMEPLTDVQPFRDEIPPAGPSVWLRAEDEAVPQRYGAWAEDTPVSFAVTGPRRFRLRAHALYTADDAALTRRLQLAARLDDDAPALLDIDTTVDTTRAYRVDGQRTVLGRRFEAFVTVPAGHHVLTVTPSAPLYAAIRASARSDYLLPALNAPPRVAAVTTPPARSPWALEAAELALGDTTDLSFATIVQRATRALLDNGHREGGAIGSALLRAEAAVRPAYPEAAALARGATAWHTFYRDLFPVTKVNRRAARHLHFVPAQLNPPGTPVADPVLSGSQLRAHAARTADAWFTPLAAGERQRYLLPGRAAPSELRVVVARPVDGAEVRLSVRYDEGPPRPLRLHPAGAPASLTHEPALAALALTAATPPLQAVGVAVLPLPIGVQSIELAAADDVPAPIDVALQLRAARPSRLDERAYLASLAAAVPDALAVLRAAVREARAEDRDPRQRELVNHWQPLVRWLRAADRRFDAVTPPTAAHAPVRPVRAAALTALVATATRDEQAGRWIEAVESWSLVVQGSPAAARDAWALRRAHALRAAGEAYLAELQFQGLCLHAHAWATGDAACSALLAAYAASDHDDDALALLAMRLLRFDDRAAGRALVTRLHATGESELALTLGLALPVDAQPREAMLQAATLLDWPRTRARFAAPAPAFSVPTAPPAPANDLIADYAGVDLLSSIERDLGGPAFRATPEVPARIVVTGPRRLRLEARPLFTGMPTEALDDWIEVRGDGRLMVIAINRNVPSSTLQVVGRPGLLAGRRVHGELALGPGRHELQVHARRTPLLLQLTASDAAVPPTAPPAAATARCTAQCVTLIEAGHATRVAAVASPTAPDVVAAAGGDWPDWPEARLLARGDVDGALAQHRGHTPAAALRRTLLRAWQAEQDPVTHGAALAAANADVAHVPATTALRALLSRLERGATWQPLTALESAGQRYLPVTGWAPEAPALRLRRALLRDSVGLAPAGVHQVLGGAERLVYRLVNLQPSTLSIALRLATLPHVAPIPAAVEIQLDDALPRVVPLSATSPREAARLAIPVGTHTVRIANQRAIPNQFIEMNLVESRPVPDAGTVERAYHVATAREPLRARVQGPAWLRIDEWRNGRLETRFRFVTAGWQQIEVRPADGAAEGLYRVAQRALGGPRVRVPVVREPPPAAVPPPWFTVPDAAPATAVAFIDRDALGGQEDGLWTAGARAVRRRDVDTAGPTDPSAEQFLETELTHRFADAAGRNVHRESLLARVREFGDPTLGARAQFDHLPQWAPLALRVAGNVYVQQPRHALEAAADVSGMVYQVRTLGPRTYHVPQASLFARWLSLERARGFDPGVLDQDVFTAYKGDHQHGYTLGDTLHYRPWLDTEFEAGVTLVSNENFSLASPDHLRGRVAARQRLGRAEVGLAYRVTHAFEDADRARALTRHVMTAEGDVEAWRTRVGWLTLGVTVSRDFNARDWYGGIELAWHHGAARGYRDFLPGEIDFEDLKTRDLARLPANEVHLQTDARL